MSKVATATASSIPALLQQRKDDSAVALRVKRLGLWQEITWQEYAASVTALAHALLGLGLQPGDRIALLSENRPEWLMADLAIQSAAAITVGIYTTSSAEQLLFYLQHSDSTGLILEDAGQLEKWLLIREQCPQVKWVIVIEPEEVGGIHRWTDVLQRGRERGAREPHSIGRLTAGLKPDDTALFIYTSGTTGDPKAAMLTHRNLLWAVDSLGKTAGLHEGDELLSFLPLSHIVERLISVAAPLRFGYRVSFTENLDTVTQNLQEIRPTVFFGVPRIWEKMLSLVELQMKDAHLLKRLAYDWSLRQVRRGRRGAGRTAANLLVFHFLRIRLGLDRVRVAISGAAPIAPEILGYFRSIGIDIREGYGLTESSGIIAIHREDGKLGSVGTAFPGVEIRISPAGEILSRSPGNFAGYHKDAEATAAALSGGWLLTGDVGELDEQGNLSITERMKDIIITAGGKNIAPQKIENQLKSSPYINDAIVIGDRRRYLTALLVLDEDNITKWAADQQLPYTTYSDLAGNPAVRLLLEAEVGRVNFSLARVETIKRFAILPKRLHHEDGDVTATLKVKRSSVARTYSELIESLY
jgi:long-chain acyl-CoA synthetase